MVVKWGTLDDDAEFHTPIPVELVSGYLSTLRASGLVGSIQGRNLKYNTIKRVAGVISVVHFDAKLNSTPCFDPDVVDALAGFNEDDDTNEAIEFDVADALPKFWLALLGLKGWRELKKMQFWAMFLVSLACVCRASCVTTFCPTVEDMQQPVETEGWDPDGYPKYIILCWRSWKCRKEDNGKKYEMRLWRNYVSPKLYPASIAAEAGAAACCF
jgi:hypothetical protein